MSSALWFVATGALLISMTVISASLKRLSLTASIIYLLLGFVLGNAGIDALSVHPLLNNSLLTLITEIAVIVSLFTAGLKLRLPLTSSEWRAPVLLATVSMLITIVIVGVVSHLLLGLSVGGALLLGAILAPTDPVLASTVQVLGPSDRDRLRFSLTAEAGLNDGTAFPFVMLGLGLLGLRDLGDWGLRWVLIDLVWAIVAGLAIGTGLATVVGKLIGVLRKVHQETKEYDDFLALGLIALSYGTAVYVHASGFLAVFAAGLALRRRERQESNFLEPMADEDEKSEPRTDTVSGEMAQSLLHFNEQMERVCELVVVVLLGAMLSRSHFTYAGVAVALTLILGVRPFSVLVGIRANERAHKSLLAWFGIRGVGSLYYLAFAIGQGVTPELARTLTGVTFSAVVLSIFLHGLSSARLMLRHERVVKESD